jgi:hypothetical protein
VSVLFFLQPLTRQDGRNQAEEEMKIKILNGFIATKKKRKQKGMIIESRVGQSQIESQQ